MKFWLIVLLLSLTAGGAPAKDKTVTVNDGHLSIALPPGWKKSEQDLKGGDSVGGFESSDQKTSFYILDLKIQNQADDVFGALDRTINNFDADKNWIVKNIGKTRESSINGRPAAYCRVELDLVSEKREVPFVFHFTMVGGRKSFFMLQASTMKPVRTVREQEVFRMFKSFKIIKE